MASFESFTDIKAWQAARNLSQEIYKVSSLDSFSRVFSLMDQIRWAGNSILLNLTEGYGWTADAEFVRFLIHARRSVKEVKADVFIALEQENLSQTQCDGMFERCKEVSKMITGLIKYLRK